MESNENQELTEEEQKVAGILKVLTEDKNLFAMKALCQEKDPSENLHNGEYFMGEIGVIFLEDRPQPPEGFPPEPPHIQIQFENYGYNLNSWISNLDGLARDMVSAGLK